MHIIYLLLLIYIFFIYINIYSVSSTRMKKTNMIPYFLLLRKLFSIDIAHTLLHYDVSPAEYGTDVKVPT